MWRQAQGHPKGTLESGSKHEIEQQEKGTGVGGLFHFGAQTVLSFNSPSSVPQRYRRTERALPVSHPAALVVTPPS
jgi:hypothetical protein